ncbi:MAG: ComF family protein [Dehalococcoidia bacterium]|nr:ComF family protein [Dehalococcoidia bacterium]
MGGSHLLRRLFGESGQLLLPARCAGCARFGTLLCEPCQAAMQPAHGPGRCPNCSARWQGADNCPRCLAWRYLDGALAAHEMTGAARQVVHALKYGRARVYAPLMAARIAPLAAAQPFDAVYPVPLHPSRYRDRGFNQAGLILDALAWPTGPGELRRIRKTATQVGKHLRERRTNVDGAFAYDGPSLAGLRVALVDDVITTGATMDECARVLREAGARSVAGFAFARASHEGTGPIRD